MKREEIVDVIREVLVDLRLNDSYGIIDGESTSKTGKRYSSLTFCKARILDGEVQVFGPKFIIVRWQTAIRSMPERGSELFNSVDELRAWLEENFRKYA